RKAIAQADQYPDVRRRSVVELAERCSYWPDQAHQIARLTLALFDRTRAIHGLTDKEREWLEYASILHDAGVHISYERHHRHSYYLIKNGDLRGFEPDEIETIALVARYHRRSPPSRRHADFGELGRKRRTIVRQLSAILRLGENDAAWTAGEVAGSRRPSRLRHRMELVGARQGRHENREEEERPDADDVQPAARHRLRG